LLTKRLVCPNSGRNNTQTGYCERYGSDLLTGATLSEADHKAIGPDRRAILHAAEYLPPHEEPGEEYPFRCATGRTIYHFHTRTKTARASQLQNAAPEAWVEMHPADAGSLGIGEGDVVRVESPRGGMEARARVSGIREGVIFAPFHYGYWDQQGEDDPDGRPRAANELTITEWDPVSKQPLFKVATVKVTKVADASGKASTAPTNTASAPVVGELGGPTPAATTGHGAAEATETVREG
jgi:ferredoxin-nitrate reductase